MEVGTGLGLMTRLLAIVLPAALAVSWVALVGPERADPNAAEALADAAGPRPLSADTEVLVVGNSLAFRGVDAELLRRELGIEGRVSVLSYGGSWAATWYAALKNRVYAEGMTPRLVVVVGTLDFMLRADRPEAVRGAEFRALLTDDEPVLDAKVLGRSRLRGPLGDVWERRGEVGSRWLKSLQALPFALAGEPDPHAAADRTLALVFDAEGATDVRLKRRAIPVVELERARARGVSPEDSLLPDLIDLAEAHGSRIVFARMPLSRAGRGEYPLPPLELERAAVGLLNDRQAGYVDLHAMSLPESAYLDGKHLNRQGAVTYTRALASALRDLGALGTDPFRAAPLPPRPPEVSRRGTPPSLGEAGDGVLVRGCAATIPFARSQILSDTYLESLGVGAVSPVVVFEDGEPVPMHRRPERPTQCPGTAYQYERAIVVWSQAEVPESARYTLALTPDLPVIGPDSDTLPGWWVYPGTDLLLEFEPDETLEDVLVRVEVSSLVLGNGRMPYVYVDDQEQVARRTGLRMTSRSPLGPSPRTIEIKAPKGGGWALVRSVLLRREDGTVIRALGSEADAGAASWMLGSPLEPEVTSDRVPEIKPLAAPVDVGLPGGLLRLEAPEFEVVSREALRARVGGGRTDLPEDHPDRVTAIEYAQRCSPVRLTQAGRKLWRVADPARLGVDELPGVYSHAGAAFLVRPDKTRADTWEAQLSEERRCDRYAWVYPGETVSVANEVALGRLHAGADTVVVGGLQFGTRRDGDQARIRVLHGGRSVLDTQVSMAQLELESPAIALTHKIPATPKDVVVEIQTPADGPYLLLNAVVLTENGLFGRL